MRKLLLCFGTASLVLGALAVPAAASAAESGSPGTQATVTIPERRIPVDNRFIPPHVRGDREFDGHGPNVFGSATLVGVGTSRLSIRLFMEAVETTSDWTTARGSSPLYLIYVAPTGQCIKSVSVGTYEEIRYLDNDHAADVFNNQVVGSFVRQWNFMGDTGGDEAGTRTGVAITTRSFQANVQPC